MKRKKEIFVLCEINQLFTVFSMGAFFPLLFSFEISPLRDRIMWITTLNQYGNFYAYISDVSPTFHFADLNKGGMTLH